MKKITLLLFVILISVIACRKSATENVSIRIENSTNQNFKEVIISDKPFSNINSSEITTYQVYEKVVELPFAKIITKDNDSIYVGALYNDPPVSYLANGKYTLKIFEDTTAYYGYNCVYIKN